ncbi:MULTISPECIES: hypothetical protein [Nostoc]|nr:MULTISPECIES: hypothetical protein [Nostoc]
MNLDFLGWSDFFTRSFGMGIWGSGRLLLTLLRGVSLYCVIG